MGTPHDHVRSTIAKQTIHDWRDEPDPIQKIVRELPIGEIRNGLYGSQSPDCISFLIANGRHVIEPSPQPDELTEKELT